MHTPVVVCKDLTKTYTSFKKTPGFAGAIKSFFAREHILVTAVKPISFNIAQGEFVGLLGPNGAGKTTILKMLSGLIHPTSGTISMFGTYHPAERERAYLRQIGMVMGQRNQLNPDLPALDSFRLAQAIYDIPRTEFQGRLDECLTLLAAADKASIPVRKLSLGERMKMELILALLHRPKLLFLDEPTIGLDFNAARSIREFLREANQKLGVTTILTSHYTKDIEELCERVIVINRGAMVYDGPLVGLDNRIQGERSVTLHLASIAEASHIQAFLLQQGVTDFQLHEGRATFFGVATRMPELLSRLLHEFPHGLFADITVSERPLEDIFSEIYQGSSL